MSAYNIIRNYKGFGREVLDDSVFESLIFPLSRGEARVIDRYHEVVGQGRERDIKSYRMSLFITQKRVIVYEKRGFFKRDRFAQIPLHELESVVVASKREERKGIKGILCVIEFIVPDDSDFASIVYTFFLSTEYEMECLKEAISALSKHLTVPVKIL